MNEPLEFKIGRYTVNKDKYGRWTRTRLPEEGGTPGRFLRVALGDFEEQIMEYLIASSDPPKTNVQPKDLIKGDCRGDDVQ